MFYKILRKEIWFSSDQYQKLLFENKKGSFINRFREYGLANTSGWWNSIYGRNFNSDETTNYVLGNLGLNNPYYALDSEPLKIVPKD